MESIQHMYTRLRQPKIRIPCILITETPCLGLPIMHWDRHGINSTHVHLSQVIKGMDSMHLVHLDVLSLRPQTNTTSASAREPLRGSLLAASAARFGPSALKVRSFWMDYMHLNHWDTMSWSSHNAVLHFHFPVCWYCSCTWVIRGEKMYLNEYSTLISSILCTKLTNDFFFFF